MGTTASSPEAPPKPATLHLKIEFRRPQGEPGSGAHAWLWNDGRELTAEEWRRAKDAIKLLIEQEDRRPR